MSKNTPFTIPDVWEDKGFILALECWKMTNAWGMTTEEVNNSFTSLINNHRDRIDKSIKKSRMDKVMKFLNDESIK
jgi:hypothetical protein